MFDKTKLKVDGKHLGDVLSFQFTDNGHDRPEDMTNLGPLATIVYTVGGKTRSLTCELETVSFGE